MEEEFEPEWLDPLFGKPEGYVEPLDGGRYLIKGKRGSYACSADDGVCDCPDHFYRKVPGEDCRHLKRLREWLKEQAPPAVEMTDEELKALFA